MDICPSKIVVVKKGQMWLAWKSVLSEVTSRARLVTGDDSSPAVCLSLSSMHRSCNGLESTNTLVLMVNFDSTAQVLNSTLVCFSPLFPAIGTLFFNLRPSFWQRFSIFYSVLFLIDPFQRMRRTCRLSWLKLAVRFATIRTATPSKCCGSGQRKASRF